MPQSTARPEVQTDPSVLLKDAKDAGICRKESLTIIFKQLMMSAAHRQNESWDIVAVAAPACEHMRGVNGAITAKCVHTTRKPLDVIQIISADYSD